MVAAGTAVAALAVRYQPASEVPAAAPTTSPVAGMSHVAPVAVSPSPSNTASPTDRRRSPTGSSSPHPSTAPQVPVPPVAARTPTDSTSAAATCPTVTGPGASRADVAAALTAAADRAYWPSDPDTRIPAALLKAIAWQESQWQSSMTGCHCEIGVLQLSADAAASVNQHFGTTYDLTTLNGNAAVGAAYLTWLLEYLAQRYFDGTTDLSNPALLHAVIAAYKLSPAAVNPTTGTPETAYTRAIVALMNNCPCQEY